MDSGSGKHHRRSSKRRKAGGASSSRRSKSRHRAPSVSFAPPPAPSRGTIRFPETKRERPVFKAFLAGYLGVFVLILLGGSHNAFALGCALLLPGIALLIRPPKVGLGRWGDLGAFGLLGFLLLAFLPRFYWPEAEWVGVAIESFGLNLPAVLSPQPWISFEAWLMALAGFAWFYAASNWSINQSGRRWLFFFLSIIIAVFAGVVVWGNLYGVRYPGAESATAFSFFPNRNQTANFLALGGVASFAYAMEGIRRRIVLPLVGVPCSALCLAGLVLGVSRAGVLLYFLGIAIWFFCSLGGRSLPRFFKVGFPIVVIAFSLVISSNERTVERIVDFASQESGIGDEFRLRVYEDSLEMIQDAPVSGFGLGAFPVVFPQYRDASANHQKVVHPESDFFWLAAEGGLGAIVFLALFLIAYLIACRGLSDGGSGSYRVSALLVVILFLIHGLVDVPGHRPGTVYFAILFAALALPRAERPAMWLRPVYWRVVGGGLFCVGLIWIAGGLFSWPLHSSLKLEAYQKDIQANVSVADYTRAKTITDKWLAARPLDWKAYFQRAQLTLAESGRRADVAEDFRRARFVEPILGLVSFEEGKAWLPYDPARAIAAWRLTLFREMENMDASFGHMLKLARKSPDLIERMGRLSEIDPHYRTYYLRSLRGSDLMRELRIEMAKDPGLARFDLLQRTEIVKHWIKYGELDSAESYLRAHADSLKDAWWLWSILLKDQAKFEEAVDSIRDNVEVPTIPRVELDDYALSRLTREYAVAPKDIMKGTALLSIYIEEQAYAKALPVLERMLEAHKPPLYLYYWRAECLYQVQEYIESWYSFETYLEALWQRSD